MSVPVVYVVSLVSLCLGAGRRRLRAPPTVPRAGPTSRSNRRRRRTLSAASKTPRTRPLHLPSVPSSLSLSRSHARARPYWTGPRSPLLLPPSPVAFATPLPFSLRGPSAPLLARSKLLACAHCTLYSFPPLTQHRMYTQTKQFFFFFFSLVEIFS